MRLRVFPVATALLTVCGCGSSASVGTTTAPRSAPAGVPTTPAAARGASVLEFHKQVDADRDDDVGAGGEDSNHASLLSFGHAARRSERYAITMLLRHYYVAAATEDGRRACSLIYSRIAEAVPEDYGASPPGPPYMQGDTCAAVLTSLFKHIHAQTVAESAAFSVGPVRLEGLHGFAVLYFRKLPERQITVRREGRSWKVLTLFDTPLP